MVNAIFRSAVHLSGKTFQEFSDVGSSGRLLYQHYDLFRDGEKVVNHQQAADLYIHYPSRKSRHFAFDQYSFQVEPVQGGVKIRAIPSDLNNDLVYSFVKETRVRWNFTRRWGRFRMKF